MSNPTTGKRLARYAASGRPTYPSPITAILISSMLGRSLRCGDLDNVTLLSVPEIFVGSNETIAQHNARPPTNRVEPADIDQFARSSVWLADIKCDLARVTHDFGDQPREIRNGNINTPADVDDVIGSVMLKQENAGISQI